MSFNSSGKIIKNATGTTTTTVDVVAAVPGKRIKVTAYCLITTAATANTAVFQSISATGTNGLWTLPLVCTAGNIGGANLAVQDPSCLFATVAGEKLTLNIAVASTVAYSIAYFDDDRN